MFAESGYIVTPPLIDQERARALRDAHDRIWAGDFDSDGFPRHPGSVKDTYDPHALRKCDNGWWVNDTIRDMVTDGKLGRVAADLLGVEKVRLWHDQVIYKPPTGDAGTAGNVGWHQDYGFWHACDTQNVATIWLALQDTDLDNGGMRTIAGSHKWGLIEDSNTFFEQDLDALHAKFSTLGEWRDEPCIIPSGGVSIHHGLTFHGSGPNTTDQPRLSIVAHVMPDGAAYSAAEQYHPNVTLLGPRPMKGQRFTGEYFPLMHE
jgi:ectoine hydroxylase-related dioxygenase (phytanoyl-CoA dioxygenase family)